MSRDELLETFAGFPARLAAAAQARAAGSRPLLAAEWGPNEIVRHLIAVEDEVWRSRLARVATEDDIHWEWIEPGLAPGLDDASLQDILAAFEAARDVTVAAVRALDDAGWARSGTHATFGVLDVAGLIGLANDHDAAHLESLRQ